MWQYSYACLRLVSIWSQTIADRRRSRIAESSAIIWKHPSAIVCDPVIVIAGEKFNVSCPFMNIFRSQNRCFLWFWSWRCRRFRTKRGNKLQQNFPLDIRHVVCFDFRACTTRVYIWHIRWTKSMATVGSAIGWDHLRLQENSSLCDRLRSSAIMWKPALNTICIGFNRNWVGSNIGRSPVTYSCGQCFHSFPLNYSLTGNITADWLGWF